MKEIVLINDTIPNKISYYLLACFLIFLPFRMLYSELALAGLGLHTLVTLDFKKLGLLLSTHVLIITSVYLLGLIGMLYSPDIKEAINVGGRQLAILLFPLVLTLNGIDLNKYKAALLKIFGFTCVVTVLYLYVTAYYAIHYNHLPFKSLFTADFMNHNFSLPIQLHATYLSMYAAFAITVFIYFFQKNSRVLLRIFYSVCIIILLAGMIQLSSRAVLVALFLIVNIIFPVCHLGGKKRIQFILMATVLSTITLVSIYNVDSFKTRYVGELKNDLGIDTLNVEFTEPRVDRWKAEMELIKRSPVVGYGSGSEKQLLKKKFLEKKFYIAYAGEYNSHSQYLSFWLNMGIGGLALYLFVLCYGFSFAWKDRDSIFLGFMIIISVVSSSESILFLNKGIFFYSFFLSLFLFTCRKNVKVVS